MTSKYGETLYNKIIKRKERSYFKFKEPEEKKQKEFEENLEIIRDEVLKTLDSYAKFISSNAYKLNDSEYVNEFAKRDIIIDICEHFGYKDNGFFYFNSSNGTTYWGDSGFVVAHGIKDLPLKDKRFYSKYSAKSIFCRLKHKLIRYLYGGKK